MSDRDAAHRTTRFAALRAWASLLLAAVFVGIWGGQLLTLRDGERVLLLNTLIAFPILALLWLALAVTALVSARGLGRIGRRARLPAFGAFALTGVACALTVVTLLL